MNMDNSKGLKRIALLLALMLFAAALPEIVDEAHAVIIRYRYRVTWRWRLKKKKPPIKLSRTKIKTTAGEYEYLYLKNASAKKVKWYSSNKKVAVVKRDGSDCEIRTKKKGKVTIIARYNGRKYYCKVNVRKKYKKILDCKDYYEDPYKTKTIKFKKMKDYSFSSNSKAKWQCWNPNEGEWVSPYKLYYYMRKNIYPVTIYYWIKNPKILKAKWGNYDDDLMFWALKMTPKKYGKTTLTVTNSYNKQKFKYKVVVEKGIGVKYPSNTSINFEEKSLTLDVGETAHIDVITDKGHELYFTKDDYTYSYPYSHSIECDWIINNDFSKTKTLSITGKSEGTATITVIDENYEKLKDTLTIDVKARNGWVNIQDIDDVYCGDSTTINAGETRYVKIYADKGRELDYELDDWYASGEWVENDDSSMYKTLKLTGVRRGETELKVFDKKDHNTSDTLKITVKDSNTTIGLNASSLKLKVGETKEIIVSTDKGCSINSYWDYSGVINFEWGEWDGNNCSFKVTGAKRGTTTLTIRDTLNENVEATIPITVEDPNTSISITDQEVSLKKGDEYTLQIETDKGGALLWKCDNDDVIQCGEGYWGSERNNWSYWYSYTASDTNTYYLPITALNAGETVLTVYDACDESVKATVKIIVN